jgi:tetratricopeptide (TPR) repeat protein
MSNASIAALGHEQPQRAITLIEESVQLFLEEGEKWGASIQFCFLAVAWRDQGDHGRAKSLAERGLALSREVGERQSISSALYTLATLSQAEHDHERARELFEEGLTVAAELGNEADVAHCLEGLASVAGDEGRIAAWCKEQPSITSPIIGPRTMEQLEDNLGATNVRSPKRIVNASMR